VLLCGGSIGRSIGGESTGEAEGSNPAPLKAEEVWELVIQLDDDSFLTREKATVRLSQLAETGSAEEKETVRQELLKGYKATTSPEVRFRVYSVLLRLAGEVKPVRRPGFLGIQMQDSSVRLPGGEVATTIKVLLVLKETAAMRRGIKVSDHIVSLDGKRFERATDPSNSASAQFGKIVRDLPVGSFVELEIYSARTRSLRKLDVMLGARPDEHITESFKRMMSNETVKAWLSQEPLEEKRL